jgi:hypothetical protein
LTARVADLNDHLVHAEGTSLVGLSERGDLAVLEVLNFPRDPPRLPLMKRYIRRLVPHCPSRFAKLDDPLHADHVTVTFPLTPTLPLRIIPLTFPLPPAGIQQRNNVIDGLVFKQLCADLA